jgi:hypothetical protein
MNRSELYEVRDIGLGAFLKCQGHVVQRIWADGERPGLHVFGFAKTDEVLADVAVYQRGEALMEPRSFLWNLKSLKGGLR